MSALSSDPHPYYPTDLELPGYKDPVVPFHHIHGVFFGITLLVGLGVWKLSGTWRDVSTWERCFCVWFAFSGAVHMIVEGAFVTNLNFYQNTEYNLLADLWKEYSKADSRYATGDSFIVSMETITAVIDGPGCWLYVYGMYTNAPWRFAVGIITSVCQCYGCTLYYATTWLDGMRDCRPEFLYFWLYFVLMNALWIAIPLVVTGHCMHAINKRITAASPAGEKGSWTIPVAKDKAT